MPKQIALNYSPYTQKQMLDYAKTDDRYFVLSEVMELFDISFYDIQQHKRKNIFVRKRGLVLYVCVDGLGFEMSAMLEIFPHIDKSSLYSALYRFRNTCEMGDSLYLSELKPILFNLEEKHPFIHERIIKPLYKERVR